MRDIASVPWAKVVGRFWLLVLKGVKMVLKPKRANISAGAKTSQRTAILQKSLSNSLINMRTNNYSNPSAIHTTRLIFVISSKCEECHLSNGSVGEEGNCGVDA